MSRHRSATRVALECCGDTNAEIRYEPARPAVHDTLADVLGEPQPEWTKARSARVRIYTFDDTNRLPDEDQGQRTVFRCPHCGQVRSITKRYAAQLARNVRRAYDSGGTPPSRIAIPWDAVTAPRRH